ncbi:DUF5011 domain-containing protein [Flaviaesturariibacter aridisoli]|uniref:DUF5011 domain-containing protein n=1 Tax=Flaviaesturariibacter aridisoli TaxID=2545761 RepID=A0A4R4DYQ8_9BACT|nr:DUF5011 domain-containing protein [Flaviaesturariibacter aridisoli]TCZ66526.1 DUF5011 domain-containing protein [Flaviaesturariibacter aridisoli]
MKKYLFGLLCMGLLLGSCKKDPVNTADRVGSSRVTRFPTFTVTGGNYRSIVQGSTYTEPGVTAAEGSTSLTVTTSGSVDAATVGVYELTYTATNSDGFPATVTRTVAVLPGPEAAGVNIAGKYANVGSFAWTAEVEKLAPGFYRSDNVWGGGSAAVVPSYILTTDGQNLILPENTLSSYGAVSGDGTLDAQGNMNLHVSLLDQGISNSLRKWKKI